MLNKRGKRDDITNFIGLLSNKIHIKIKQIIFNELLHKYHNSEDTLIIIKDKKEDIITKKAKEKEKDLPYQDIKSNTNINSDIIKEYDAQGNIIYEGEYKNGMRNGKGKAFENNKVLFEGKYQNGKMWNGFEYKYLEDGKIRRNEYFKGKIKFEGEYLNDKKNGNGKEYNTKGKLIYEGEYSNGKRNGRGIEYNTDGKFEGEFKNGKKWNGTGYNKNGEIDYDIFDGYGTLKEYYGDKLIYEGECKKGYRHGKGREYNYFTGKLIYNGVFLYGKKFVDTLDN